MTDYVQEKRAVKTYAYAASKAEPYIFNFVSFAGLLLPVKG